jgi:hypothetical protein
MHDGFELCKGLGLADHRSRQLFTVNDSLMRRIRKSRLDQRRGLSAIEAMNRRVGVVYRNAGFRK